MTRIWITRTEPGAQKSAHAWADAGFEPVVAPLLTVTPISVKKDVPDDAHLVFTSAHGVRHCGLNGGKQTVYTVGDATAEIAKLHGFTNVISANGDWADLLTLIRPTDDPIIHLSGRTVRGRLIDGLKDKGLNASRIIVYETQTVSQWPFDPADVQAIALYSPMAADALRALPKRDLSHLAAYCLSPAVASGLSGFEIKIASRPNEAALIACSRADDP